MVGRVPSGHRAGRAERAGGKDSRCSNATLGGGQCGWAAHTPCSSDERACGIDALGYLSDEQLMAEAATWRVMLAPIFATTGANTKVILALQLGLPLVTTAAAAAPFGLAAGGDGGFLSNATPTAEQIARAGGIGGTAAGGIGGAAAAVGSSGGAAAVRSRQRRSWPRSPYIHTYMHAYMHACMHTGGLDTAGAGRAHRPSALGAARCRTPRRCWHPPIASARTQQRAGRGCACNAAMGGAYTRPAPTRATCIVGSPHGR